jgi:hypothetical protein
MNEKNVNVVVKYILNSGQQINSDQIDTLRHQFPLGLLNGEQKQRAIQNLISRAQNNSTVILEIHEDGILKNNLV